MGPARRAEIRDSACISIDRARDLPFQSLKSYQMDGLKQRIQVPRSTLAARLEGLLCPLCLSFQGGLVIGFLGAGKSFSGIANMSQEERAA